MQLILFLKIYLIVMIAIKLKTSRIANVKIPISSQNQGSFCFNLLFFSVFLKQHSVKSV